MCKTYTVGMQENSLVNWLIGRGIAPSILEQFEVTVDTHYSLDECIRIPVHNESGDVLFSKYRRSPFDTSSGAKYLYQSGTTAQLYGWHMAKDHDTVLVCEGELDALVAWSNNVPAVSSTGGCRAWKDEWSELLRDKILYIAYDNDAPGQEGMAALVHKLPHAAPVFIPRAAGIKDITDYVKRGGDLHELIRSARVFTTEESVRDDMARRIAVFEDVTFHEKMLELMRPPVPERHARKVVSDSKLERAKQCDIRTLMRFTRNKARCVWHDEKTPSMTYYPKTNTVYCFGCSRHGDAIDVYRTLHQCSFTTAVNALNYDA